MIEKREGWRYHYRSKMSTALAGWDRRSPYNFSVIFTVENAPAEWWWRESRAKCRLLCVILTVRLCLCPWMVFVSYKAARYTRGTNGSWHMASKRRPKTTVVLEIGLLTRCSHALEYDGRFCFYVGLQVADQRSPLVQDMRQSNCEFPAAGKESILYFCCGREVTRKDGVEVTWYLPSSMMLPRKLTSGRWNCTSWIALWSFLLLLPCLFFFIFLCSR